MRLLWPCPVRVPCRVGHSLYSCLCCSAFLKDAATMRLLTLNYFNYYEYFGQGLYVLVDPGTSNALGAIAVNYTNRAGSLSDKRRRKNVDSALRTHFDVCVEVVNGDNMFLADLYLRTLDQCARLESVGSVQPTETSNIKYFPYRDRTCMPYSWTGDMGSVVCSAK